jgi:hypothetical protein
MEFGDKVTGYLVGRYKAKMMVEDAVGKIENEIREALENTEELKNTPVKISFGDTICDIRIYDYVFNIDIEDIIHECAKKINSINPEYINNTIRNKILDIIK